jgi:predicted RNase H-like HicB family nuclease
MTTTPPRATIVGMEPSLWEDEGQWTAHDPTVPGVYGLGPSRAAAETDFREALSELHAYLRDIGEAVPS